MISVARNAGRLREERDARTTLITETVPTAALAKDLRSELHDLFAASYRGANLPYLDDSIARLAHLAIARSGAHLVGFALGEVRTLEIPRLGPRQVALAGLCCIHPAHRRQGLFRRLETMAVLAGEPAPTDRVLSAGRMAHPVSFRIMNQYESVVPRPGHTPTGWQQQVGCAIANAYGVLSRFDPTTFVCRGTGSPIGEPRLEFDVTPREWEAFAAVRRERGDSLLGLCWIPDAPPGW